MEKTKEAKIACAMIIKDDTEAGELRRALKTVAPHVDGLYITGTNQPIKEIEKICKEYKGVFSYFPWVKHFSKARNFNFSQVPKEFDYIFWMDVDDMLQGGESLHKLANLGLKNNIGAFFARYLYSVELDEQGKITHINIEHLRERLIRNNDNYEWVAPIHETLIPKTPMNQTDTNDFLLVHLTSLPQMAESMYRNIEILEQEVIDNPTDPRPIYYLAKAYFDTKDPMVLNDKLGDGVDSLTVELIKQYLSTSGWAEERAQACEYLSMIYRERGDYQMAIDILQKALLDWPQYPSLYIQLSLCYIMLKDWGKALHWVKMATSTEMPKTTLVVQPKDYQMMVLECLFHIHFNTENMDLSEKVIDKLVDIAPTEINLARQKEVREWRAKNNLAHWVIKLANHLSQTQQVGKLRALINSIPSEIETAPVLVQLRNDLTPPKTWDKNSVVIYCGQGWEKWSPASVVNGIGGSEEAVIYVSNALTKLGWKVTVFGDPEEEGNYAGVEYLPYYYFNTKDTFNIFIAWRNIGMFDFDIKTKKAYLWNHDIQNPLTYTPERVAKIDKVMFLSKWHRQNVPQLPENKIMYSSNGLNI